MASPQTNNLIAKKVCWYETGAIAFIIALSWFDEILDIPHVLLGGAATPINWRESFFESMVIAVVGALIIRHTYKLLTKVSYLESILPVCASCKKIRLDQEFWHDIKHFIQEVSVFFRVYRGIYRWLFKDLLESFPSRRASAKET